MFTGGTMCDEQDGVGKKKPSTLTLVRQFSICRLQPIWGIEADPFMRVT